MPDVAANQRARTAQAFARCGVTAHRKAKQKTEKPEQRKSDSYVSPKGDLSQSSSHTPKRAKLIIATKMDVIPAIHERDVRSSDIRFFPAGKTAP